VVWFSLHLPGLNLGPAVVGPITVGAWLVLAAVGARHWRARTVEGAVAGFLTALISLLALGSVLVDQPDPAAYGEAQAPFRPAAPLFGLGFLAAGVVIGAVGALAGGRRGAPRAAATDVALDPWPARIAAVVALSYVPLVLLGGVVTSTESGLAVRGWPDTFGANMFLYPISLMSQPRIYFEHSHRLFGTLAGLATIILWLSTLASPKVRGRFGVWATLLLLAVIVQGVVGGQRVLLGNPYLGALHGAFGQVVLAFAAVLALWMSPAYVGVPQLEPGKTRPMRTMASAALAVSIVQLLLGALFRHLRRGENPASMHVVWTHAAFSLVVVALAIIAGSMLIRFAKDRRDSLPGGLSPRLRMHGASIHGAVGIQFVLGWVTLLAVMTGEARGAVPTAEQLSDAAPVPLVEAILATAHQANGALYLVLLSLAWAWTGRLHRAARR
jgi:heme A synthase